jgi:soluble lytic murein transglycosylase
VKFSNQPINKNKEPSFEGIKRKQKITAVIFVILGALLLGIAVVSFLGLREILFPEAFRSIIYKEASRNSIDPLLIAAIIFHESHFGVNKIESKGGVGLMQVRPQTLTELERHKYLNKGEIQDRELMNPETNVLAGITYLKLLERLLLSSSTRFEKIKKWFNGDPTLVMLHGYNAGPTFVFRKLLDVATSKEEYEELVRKRRPTTFKYGQNIMSTYKKLKWINMFYPYLY